MEFSGSSLRGIISTALCIWQSLVRCFLRQYLAVTCAVFSTTRQSLVPSSPLEYKSMDFSGRRLLVCFPYSVLLDSTVDTCLASVYEAFWLPHCIELRSCSSSKVVDIHVFTQMLFPVVQPVWRTKEISQLQFTLGGRCPWYAVVQLLFRSCSSP